MKKRIILAVTILLVFGLTIAAFAYNKSGETNTAAMDCCLKSDDCPLKNKVAETAAKDDCCLKDDTCPLKDKQTQTSAIDMKNVVVAGSGESCCQPGADCCKSGSCCKDKHS